MRRIAATLLALIAVTCSGQLTPQQIENSAAPYRFYSARDLAVADTYLMSVLVGFSATSPATILANAAAWKAFSDRDLQNAQTYILSQLSGSLIINAQSTNNGVLSTNGNNILISPTNTISVFTNAGDAIAIGWNFPIGSVLGNGIWIGGGGAGQGGSVGTNSIAIGGGSGAAGVNTDFTYANQGAIAIGNQIDDFGPGGIVIGNAASTFASAGSWNAIIIGNNSSDNGSAVTNFAIYGHNFSSPAANTVYFGNGGGGGTNSGRTRNFVFMNGGAYNDDGAMIGNGFGLTNLISRSKTNALPAAVLTVDNSYMTNVTADFTLGNFANVPANTTWNIWLYATNNNSGANRKITAPNGCAGSYLGVSLGSPPFYVITNNQSALIWFWGYGQMVSNMVVYPRF